MSTDGAHLPLRVLGSQRSYFTGKLEGYLRYKEIPHRFESMTGRDFRATRANTGAMQMPAVELADGRWITDTTPIIAWLERLHPEPALIPADPLQAFVSRLVEDYADEWLWRSAMHYRWSYSLSRAQVGRELAAEVARELPLPVGLKRHFLSLRQFTVFVRGDGVRRDTRAHVERGYARALEILEAILASRPFLLGERPSLADVGLFGPMFRHFSIDPVPAAIMRRDAPRTFAWVARLWNARASECSGPLVAGIPEDWRALLVEIGQTHLEQLAANACAWNEGRARYEMEIQGTRYRRVPMSRYRVWCLEELRRHYCELPEQAAVGARALLERTGCWEPLWRVDVKPSGVDPERRAPFARGQRVFAPS